MDNIKLLINIEGNVLVAIKELKSQFTHLTGIVDSFKDNTVNSFNKIANEFDVVKYGAWVDVLEEVGNTFSEIAQSGMDFEQSMADLSAITGITGKDLKELEKTARRVGRSSALGASEAAEAFKLLASQISVDKIGIDGLKELQRQTILLSQASGLDLPTAANAMSAAINQFGLDASEAARVVNVLAAGAKYGAAEVPELAQSFKVAGSAAAGAGLDMEQLVGGLEVLSKNAIKGAEAGTAMRNIILRMQTALGVDFSQTSLSEALAALKPKLKDTEFLVKTFGMENVNAAQFLIQNAEAVDEMTGKVTGTNVAMEQAEIRTGTLSHKMAKLKAWVTDLQIGFTKLTGWMMPAVDVSIRLGRAITALIPLMKVLKLLTWQNIKAMMVGIAMKTKNMVLTLRDISLKGILAARTAVVTAAQWALNLAMSANPIGLIIAGIVALGAAFVWVAKKFGWFGDTFAKIWDWIKKKVIEPLKKAIGWIKGLFGDDNEISGEVTVKAETEDTVRPVVKENKAPEDILPGLYKRTRFSGSKTQAGGTVHGGGTSGGGRNVTVRIEKLVDKLIVQAQNLTESKARIRDMVSEALTSAVRDTEAAIS